MIAEDLTMHLHSFFTQRPHYIETVSFKFSLPLKCNILYSLWKEMGVGYLHTKKVLFFVFCIFIFLF